MAICKICNQNKFKFYLGKNDSGWPIYIDAHKRKWTGSICPECVPGYKRLLENKNYPEKECPYCKKMYKPKHIHSRRCMDPKCIRRDRTLYEIERQKKLKSVNK